MSATVLPVTPVTQRLQSLCTNAAAIVHRREDSMRYICRNVTAAAITAAIFVASPARAGDDGLFAGENRYLVTNLTSDTMGVAQNTDRVLQNAWGVAFTPANSPFWISDNATGCSTLYDGQGVPQPNPPLQVKIPLPGGVIPPTACIHNDPKTPSTPTPAAPTGLVWNPTTSTTTGFLVPGTSKPATFIWDTEDGTISAWTGGLTSPDQAVIAVDNPNPNTNTGAVYKGLVVGVNSNGVFLFATNFRAGTVDVFDHTYTKVTTSGGFADPKIPAGFAPFGIQNIDGNLFVTYAKQNAQSTTMSPGRATALLTFSILTGIC